MKEHVVIAGLLPGGPGEQAGLKAGDVILAVDGDEVRDRRTFYHLLWRRPPGDEVTLRVFRGRQVQTVRVASGDVEEFFASGPAARHDAARRLYGRLPPEDRRDAPLRRSGRPGDP